MCAYHESMVLNLEQTVIEKLRRLPPDKQRKVLDFAEALEHRVESPKPGKSLYGLWADLKVDVTEQDIAEVRREMWAKFPRDGT